VGSLFQFSHRPRMRCSYLFALHVTHWGHICFLTGNSIFSRSFGLPDPIFFLLPPFPSMNPPFLNLSLHLVFRVGLWGFCDENFGPPPFCIQGFFLESKFKWLGHAGGAKTPPLLSRWFLFFLFFFFCLFAVGCSFFFPFLLCFVFTLMDLLPYLLKTFLSSTSVPGTPPGWSPSTGFVQILLPKISFPTPLPHFFLKVSPFNRTKIVFFEPAFSKALLSPSQWNPLELSCRIQNKVPPGMKGLVEGRFLVFCVFGTFFPCFSIS